MSMSAFQSSYRQLGVTLKMADGSKTAPDLVLGCMRGEENLGKPFEYELTLFTQDSGHQNAPEVLDRSTMGGLLGGEACVSLDYRPGIQDESRYFHGMITACSYLGPVRGTGISMYKVMVKPKLHLLEISQEYRIFRDVSTIEIVRMVLTHAELEEGIDFVFDLDQNEDGIRRQTIQYEESDLNFIHRLMEQIGVSYRFVHTQDGHCMVLTNHNSQIPDIHDPTGQSRDQHPPVTYLFPHQELKDSFGIHHYQFSYETCTQTIQGSYVHHSNADKVHKISSQLFEDPFDYAKNQKHFKKRHYPFGHYIHYPGESDQPLWTGDPSQSKSGLPTVMAARERSYSDHYIAHSNHRHLQCGYSFDFSQHPMEHENEKKLIIAASYELYAEQFPYLKEMTDQDQPVFQARIKVQPEAHVFVTPHQSEKPSIAGVHSATVVHEKADGSLDIKGTEKRVDANSLLGVRVKIHWADHEAAIKGNNPNQITDYIRVSQFWAGKQRGAVFTPRVGDEVLVAFFHGNPDDPVIVGSMYNSTNTPFIDPSHHPLLSGIRTRTSTLAGEKDLPEGYESHHYADLMFNDDAESEEKGLTLRISQGSTEDDPYLITEGSENINLAEGAAGLMIKSPKKDSEETLLALSSGKDTQTVYTGTKEILLRNISTNVGGMTSTGWSEFGISHFSVSIASKAISSVKQMTPGAVLVTNFKGNTIRSYIGNNELVTGLMNPAALVEFGSSLAEWALVGSSRIKDRNELIQQGAELAAKLPALVMMIKSSYAQFKNPNVAMGAFTCLEMVPGVLKAESKDRAGAKAELLMSRQLFEVEVHENLETSQFRISPNFLRSQSSSQQSQAISQVSVNGIEQSYVSQGQNSSLIMTAGLLELSQSGAMVVSQQFTQEGALISNVATALPDGPAALIAAVEAAAATRDARQAAELAGDQLDAGNELGLMADAMPGAAAAATAGSGPQAIGDGAGAGADALIFAGDQAEDEAQLGVDIARRGAMIAQRAAPPMSRMVMGPDLIVLNAGELGGGLVLDQMNASICLGPSVLSATAAEAAIIAPAAQISAAQVQVAPPEVPAAAEQAEAGRAAGELQAESAAAAASVSDEGAQSGDAEAEQAASQAAIASRRALKQEGDDDAA